MADDLTALEDWAAPLLAKLTPSARRKAAKAIALALRKSQQQRIAQQQNPDGSPFEPRKPQPGKLRRKRGRIKRAAMFAKLRRPKYLKARADGDTATVGYTGRAAAIARVHQEGGMDKVNKRILARYPRRVLLGFSAADRELVRDVLLAQLSQ
ncbi:MAG: phage virion morphogenesis protein [Rhodanobacter sp.]